MVKSYLFGAMVAFGGMHRATSTTLIFGGAATNGPVLTFEQNPNAAPLEPNLDFVPGAPEFVPAPGQSRVFPTVQFPIDSNVGGGTTVINAPPLPLIPDLPPNEGLIPIPQQQQNGGFMPNPIENAGGATLTFGGQPANGDTFIGALPIPLPALPGQGGAPPLPPPPPPAQDSNNNPPPDQPPFPVTPGMDSNVPPPPPADANNNNNPPLNPPQPPTDPLPPTQPQQPVDNPQSVVAANSNSVNVVPDIHGREATPNHSEMEQVNLTLSQHSQILIALLMSFCFGCTMMRWCVCNKKKRNGDSYSAGNHTAEADIDWSDHTEEEDDDDIDRRRSRKSREQVPDDSVMEDDRLEIDDDNVKIFIPRKPDEFIARGNVESNEDEEEEESEHVVVDENEETDEETRAIMREFRDSDDEYVD